MRNHQWIGSGKIAPWLALALALGGLGCSADVNDAAGEDEGSVDAVGQAVLHGESPFISDYIFFETPKTWAQAEAICEGLDPTNSRYRLVAPSTAEEQEWLHNQEIGHGGGRWWLGVNDQKTEGQFMTGYGTDPFLGQIGSPITFTQWHAGEPNNSGNEDCVMDNYYSDMGWNDSNCGNTAKFICARAANLIPPLPATAIHHFDRSSGNTNNALLNWDGFPISLTAGQTITLGTCGLPQATADGDTFLRVYKPGGQQVAFSDDGCYGDGRGSNLSFIAPTTGTYDLRSGCYANDGCSGDVAWTIR